MNVIDIILKKKDNLPLTKEEIDYVIFNYVNGSIPDYQMSSLLMAIVINGMNFDETYYLTMAMLNSGDRIDLSHINDIIVDKHSTGGIGDKATLVLVPIVAANDVFVAKISGKGLGYTGGTIDKLESIKGFNTKLTNEEFTEHVKNIKAAIMYGGSNLVPADKKIYALRDVTGTVESIPLIASSIMSKKLATGANRIVIDLKVGNGALMKNLADAKELATTMIEIGKRNNTKVICVLSNMNEPLGYAIGNALEIKEAIDVLKGTGPKDLIDLSLTMASIMITLGKDISIDEARKLVIESINNGRAYKKFEEIVKNQQGDINDIKISEKTKEVLATHEGFISSIEAQELGSLTKNLKAGRTKKDDLIDYTVGIVIHKKVGDQVKVGQSLATIYYNEDLIDTNAVLNCFKISDTYNKEPLIYEVMGDL